MNYKSLLAQQKEFVNSGQTLDLKQRISNLKKIKKAIKQNEDKILSALYKDLHKSKYEAYMSEIAICYEEINFTIKHLSNWMKPQKVPSPFFLFPSKSKIVSEPFGSVLIMAPWNYPFQLVISPLIAAWAAGNSAFVKPSEMALHTQDVLLDILSETFDSNLVVAVGGGVKECEELLECDFDFIFFTGSPGVGKVVMRAAAENLTPICLELGGKSPCIVDDSADLKVAARRITWGKFYNAGQTCVAPDYVYVKSSVKDKLVQLLNENIKQFFGGNPKDSADFGRIVNNRNYLRLVDLLSDQELDNRSAFDEQNLYVPPTLLGEVNWSSKVMQDEIFGPFLPILAYDNIEDVIGEIVDRPKPLALYLFTNSDSLKRKIINQTSSGGMSINDVIMHLSNPRLPFGGVGSSGMGAYHGKHGYDLLSHKKSVLVKSTKLDSEMRYPPYTEKKWRLLKRFM